MPGTVRDVLRMTHLIAPLAAAPPSLPETLASGLRTLLEGESPVSLPFLLSPLLPTSETSDS